jgi:hypothetical protein
MPFMRNSLLSSLLILASGGSCACSIVLPSTPYDTNFIHVEAAKGELRIELPANARGVLYRAEPRSIPIASRHDGIDVYSKLPRELQASDFVVHDLTEDRRVSARLDYLEVASKFQRRIRSSFLSDKYSELELSDPRYARSEDLEAVVARYHLRDISAAIQKEQGLYRIGPADGFVMGHSYSIRALRDGSKYPVHLSIVAPMPVQEGEQFALLADGPPSAMQFPASLCGGLKASLVQPLRYAIPPARARFAKLATVFTMHRFEGADADLTGKPAGKYVQVFSLDQNPDPLRAITYARCRISRAPLPQRFVKGYIGMLEIEDVLHETAALEVVFGDALRDACFPLKNENDRQSPSLRLQPVPRT